MVPTGCNFGYDVMVFAGKALFLRNRQAPEIVEELAGRNVRLSASEVDYLGKKFVVYLALAHRRCAPRLRESMRHQGGYVLHLDGTCEGGGPMLMSRLDSLSEIVLGNVKPKLSDSCGRNVHLRIKEAFVLTLLVEWWTERRNCLVTTLFSALNAATWTRKAVLVHTPSVAMADQWVCY